MNPRVYSVLLLTLLVALFVQQQVEAGIVGNVLPGEHYERIYDRIGRHLENEFPFEKNPSEDFKQAIGWLETRISSAKFSAETDNLSTVLDQLKALERLKDDEKCNSESLEVLEANNRATKGLALKFHDEFESKSRIVMLVHHYFLLHANSCKKHYLDLLNSASSIDKKDLETVQIIRDGFFAAFVNRPPQIGRHRQKYEWRPVVKEDKLPKISEWETGILMNKAEYPFDEIESPDAILKYLSRNDPNKKFLEIGKAKVVSRIRIRKLFEKYMVEPCKNYVSNKLDVAKMHKFDNELLVLDMYRGDDELLKTRLGYEICENIAGQKSEDAFESVIESLKDPSKQWTHSYLDDVEQRRQKE